MAAKRELANYSRTVPNRYDLPEALRIAQRAANWTYKARYVILGAYSITIESRPPANGMQEYMEVLPNETMAS